MSNDKIEEIRKRHEEGGIGKLPMAALAEAHDDRATLLAEVERLRADLAVQQGCCDGAAAQDAHIRQEREEHRAEIERLRAENEKLRAALKPFAALHLWPDDVGDHIASDIRSDEDWIEKENDDSKEDLFVRRGDIRIARNALEGGR